MRPGLATLTLILLLACSKSKNEKIRLAIDEANFHLTENRCDEALEALDDVSYQDNNADFIMAQASSWACKGGYSSITFFLEDLPNMESASSAILGSLATFSTSEMEGEDDEKFKHLRQALSLLLLPGGNTVSSHEERKKVLGLSAQDVERLEVFALYLILIQMGKYTYFYGNSGSDGVKGDGDGDNECYLSYKNTAAEAIAILTGGSCDPSMGGSGHDELTGNRDLMCYGVILFNNFIDIIGNLAFRGDNADELVNVGSTISDLCSQVTGTDLGDICTVKTLKSCVDNDTKHSDDHLEIFHAAVYETMHQ